MQAVLILIAIDRQMFHTLSHVVFRTIESSGGIIALLFSKHHSFPSILVKTWSKFDSLCVWPVVTRHRRH